MPIPANPPHYEDQSEWLDHPKSAKAVASLASDVDLSTYFPAGYARELYIAGGATGNLTVIHAADTVAVTYVLPVGAGAPSVTMRGLFTVIKSTTTIAAANIIVRE